MIQRLRRKSVADSILVELPKDVNGRLKIQIVADVRDFINVLIASRLITRVSSTKPGTVLLEARKLWLLVHILCEGWVKDRVVFLILLDHLK